MEQINILDKFLKDNQGNLDKHYLKQKQKLSLLEFNEQGLKQAAVEIQSGRLVAFQTETVYGLGADATNEAALIKIFQTKQRPLNDPLIVHVCSVDQALKLIEISEQVKQFFLFLAAKFWPGPLTMIMKSNEAIIPNIVTANTGFVGIRMPKTEVALKLIEESDRPIAAPSANLFMHVSPTQAIHVFNDFYDQEISLIVGGNSQFGIESTVIKIQEINELNEIAIQVLRKGSVSVKQLEDQVKEFSVVVKISIPDKKSDSCKEAPGQLLKHYAPKVPCFIAKLNVSLQYPEEKEFCSINQCGVIDFKGVLKQNANQLKAYKELSLIGDFSEAMNGLYSALRELENLEGIEVIIISPIDVDGKNQQFMETLLDKVTRASEGKFAFISNNKVYLSMIK